MSETEFEKFEPVEGIGYVPVSKGGNAFLIAGATSSRVGQIVVWLSDTPEKHKKAADRVRAGRWVVGPEFSAELDFDKQYATIEVIAEVRKANARAAQAEKDARKAQRQVKAALKSAAQPQPAPEPAPAPEPEVPVSVEPEAPVEPITEDVREDAVAAAEAVAPVSDDEAAQLMRDAKELLGEGVNY